ncbi:MAG TPA: BON domain-containing protein [Pseudodesulfovibrio sp.]|nr:BON domain-containing protein [Pseudodesulfovibrio sp.]
MFRLKLLVAISIIFLLPGCAMVPFGIGLIPGAPSYVSSIIGGGQSIYETAVDERTTEQQMLDAIVAGHAQAELYKNKDIRTDQITTYCYFGKLYLVGEYDSQEQLRTIYECVDKVEGKRQVVSRLYLRDTGGENDFFSDQAMYAELRTQLMADFEVTSTPVEVQIVQGDIILLGVIHDKEERDRIMAHAMSMDGVNRVVSYLYHQENAGPEPQVMTAQLAPAPERPREIPPPPKVKPQKTRPKVERRPKPESHPVLAVSNPDRGR